VITKRHGAVLGLVVAGALVLPACGTDDNSLPSGNTTGSAASGVACAGKKQLTGEGSSAQNNAMQEFVAAYNAACPDHDVAYNASGSGAGIKQFNAKQVDFAGSDSPLSKDKGEVDAAAQRCEGNPAWHLPMVFGPVAIAYNLPGVEGLTLDGGTIAKIFNGSITTWNDPAIAALNGDKTLPDRNIVVIYRSDESGTTDNFQKYLETASAGAWTQGGGKQFKGGVGEGRAKSQGVADAVKSTEGAVTYVEASFAKNAGLGMARIDNGSGPVELTDATAGKAIAGAKIAGEGHDMVLDLDSLYGTQEPGAYPLVLVTYEIVCSKGYDAETAQAVKSFLTVAATSGQENLAKVGYVPLPQEFRAKLQDAIRAIS